MSQTAVALKVLLNGASRHGLHEHQGKLPTRALCTTLTVTPCKRGPTRFTCCAWNVLFLRPLTDIREPFSRSPSKKFNAWRVHPSQVGMGSKRRRVPSSRRGNNNNRRWCCAYTPTREGPSAAMPTHTRAHTSHARTHITRARIHARIETSSSYTHTYARVCTHNHRRTRTH